MQVIPRTLLMSYLNDPMTWSRALRSTAVLLAVFAGGGLAHAAPAATTGRGL